MTSSSFFIENVVGTNLRTFGNIIQLAFELIYYQSSQNKNMIIIHSLRQTACCFVLLSMATWLRDQNTVNSIYAT